VYPFGKVEGKLPLSQDPVVMIAYRDMHKLVERLLRAFKDSHTLTTLPDDLLHYSEPRILSVRECARLQSFPDWYAFRGKYTTGGHLRVKQCPRYTQVGNAVPPFVAESLGRLIRHLRDQLFHDCCNRQHAERSAAIER
jgi:site-specific DNA-cytosine methylase